VPGPVWAELAVPVTFSPSSLSLNVAGVVVPSTLNDTSQSPEIGSELCAKPP